MMRLFAEQARLVNLCPGNGFPVKAGWLRAGNGLAHRRYYDA